MPEPHEHPTFFERQPRKGLLAFAVLAPGLAWFLGLGLDYLFVRAACSEQNLLPLHLVTLVTLGACVAGGLAGLREWRQVGNAGTLEGSDAAARARFLAAVAMLGALLFSLAIVAQWWGKLFLNPCMAI